MLRTKSIDVEDESLQENSRNHCETDLCPDPLGGYNERKWLGLRVGSAV